MCVGLTLGQGYHLLWLIGIGPHFRCEMSAPAGETSCSDFLFKQMCSCYIWCYNIYHVLCLCSKNPLTFNTVSASQVEHFYELHTYEILLSPFHHIGTISKTVLWETLWSKNFSLRAASQAIVVLCLDNGTTASPHFKPWLPSSLLNEKMVTHFHLPVESLNVKMLCIRLSA